MKAIALGCEDLHAHAALRGDAGLPLLAGKSAPTGGKRVRAGQQAWASPRTLHRLELGAEEEAASDRCQRIVPRFAVCDALLAALEVESHRWASRELWLDLDATDDPLHGPQAGRFLHGHYGCYGYLPQSLSWERRSLRSAQAAR